MVQLDTGKIKTLSEEEVGVGDNYTLPHPIWSKEETESVQITHTPPKDKVDKVQVE